MEPKEKKKRKTRYRKGRTQSIPTDLVSLTDLTIEILSRLPEKSVARFSCVSKLWSSITSDPSFPRPRLLLCFQKYDDSELYVSSIPQHTQNSNMSYSSSLSFDHHHMMKLPSCYNRFSSKESVHGLICFQESENPIVWNPSTRQFIALPILPIPCKDWKKTTLLLGYDPIEAQKSWRNVKTNITHRPTSDTYERYIEGFTHAGEFIFVPTRRSQSSYILLCDPVKNSWRKFEFKGLADQVSLHNEHRPYALHVFPNHIDSQVSL
ncbi:unnamed protein product [Brassica napus]|uniref:(rape) hypothetical protein n=1 Tax=Brassica napus TaxID=3708 RepID=A0A816Y8L1_BRANA|nr:unnamed protein product [Brassica napus]